MPLLVATSPSRRDFTVHGEMVAIQFAQQKLKTFALKDKTGAKEYCLFTSCEPCAMCLGGTFWSGVSKMVCAATKADAESIGFDEVGMKMLYAAIRQSRRLDSVGFLPVFRS